MAGLTNNIENFLKQLLSDAEDGIIEIGRNDLASRFNCAPSQINYVLTTRFTPVKGYYIESRRGGSGYIKIIKLDYEDEVSMAELLFNSIGKNITKDRASSIIKSLRENNFLSMREELIFNHAIADSSLIHVNFDSRNYVRADILKNMILAFFR